MTKKLSGKVALVTGGSRGIGAASALALADEGANVAICARNPDEVGKVVKTLAAKGVKPTFVEGYDRSEWILLDYFDFIVHIFSEKAREFYDLERLWRAGKRRDAHELIAQRAL